MGAAAKPQNASIVIGFTLLCDWRVMIFCVASTPEVTNNQSSYDLYLCLHGIHRLIDVDWLMRAFSFLRSNHLMNIITSVHHLTKQLPGVCYRAWNMFLFLGGCGGGVCQRELKQREMSLAPYIYFY